MQGLAQIRNPDDVSKVVEAAHAAAKAQQLADDFKRQALEAVSPQDKELLLAQSKQKEIEARKHSKKAHRLASGTWQGAAGGGSIGMAIGAGLGTVVGTLVGTIASIPTTGLGVLVGIPVGWLHGPWTKMDPKTGEKVVDGEGGGEKGGSGNQGHDLVAENGHEGHAGVSNDEGKGTGSDSGDESEMTDEETHQKVIAAVKVAEEQEGKSEQPDNKAEDRKPENGAEEEHEAQKVERTLGSVRRARIAEESGLDLRDPMPMTLTEES